MTISIPLICLIIAFALFCVEALLGRSVHALAVGFSVLAIGLILGP